MCWFQVAYISFRVQGSIVALLARGAARGDVSARLQLMQLMAARTALQLMQLMQLMELMQPLASRQVASTHFPKMCFR